MHTASTVPIWTPATHVARELGFSTRFLISEAERGRLPLRIARHGEKRCMTYVHTADLDAYRRSVSEGAPR